MEAHLQLPKAWERKSLQYKYYVCSSIQPSDDNYEHLAHSGGGIYNRCLVPNRNYHYDARGNFSLIMCIACSAVFCMIIAPYISLYADQCYHHFDDFICPTRPPDSWTDRLKKLFSFKDVNDLKLQSLSEHLRCYTSNPTRMNQDVSGAAEDIMHKFTDVYNSYSCSRNGKPKLNENNKVLSVRAYLRYCYVYIVLCCNITGSTVIE